MRTHSIIFLLCAFWPSIASGETACLDAAVKAEAEHKIPGKLLQAITLVETGRGDKAGDLVAWPWTTNIDSTGQYFDSKRDVKRFVRERIRAGDTSIDIGCFQINTKWHGDAFASVDEMIDPNTAADYAAKFLTDLKDEFGDWNTAAAKYHSRTPVFANRYAQKLSAIQTSLQDSDTVQGFATEFRPRSAASSGEELNFGGVTLTMFTDAKPLFERRAQRSLFDKAASP